MYTTPRKSLCALVALLCTTAAPAEAQFQQLFRSLQAAPICTQLKEWVASVPSAAGSRRIEDMLPLIEDARFEKSFGKRYEQLTMADFRELQSGMAQCQRGGNFTPAEAQTVQYLLNPSTHAQISRQAGAVRAQRSQLESTLAELDQLQATEEDLRKLNAIQARLAPTLRTATADERNTVTARIEATRTRITVPVQRERVARAIADARGSEGLASLGRLHTALGGAGLPAAELNTLRQQVAVHITELAGPVVEEERSAAAALGSGLPGLERGVQYLAGFDARYQGIANLLPELGAVSQGVIDRRSTMLNEFQPALMAELKRATTEAQVEQTLSRYLTPAERRGSQRALVAAAQERLTSVRQSAENERVFGAKADAAPPAKSASAPAATTRGRAPRAFLEDAAELRKYNEGGLIKAIYDGALTGVPSDVLYVRLYLLQHARVFSEECRMFTLAEIRQLEQAAEADLNSRSLQEGLQAMRDLSSLGRVASVNQKRNDAAAFADKDLELLIQTYGGCDAAQMKQYAKNVGSYLRNVKRR